MRCSPNKGVDTLPKRIPERQCVGCQEQKPKRSMVRVVLTPTGDIVIDASGKMAGRGAYICPQRSCFDQAKKRRSLDRGLKTSVQPELYEQLAAVVAASNQTGSDAGG